jgi:hypothetical protein
MGKWGGRMRKVGGDDNHTVLSRSKKVRANSLDV